MFYAWKSTQIFHGMLDTTVGNTVPDNQPDVTAGHRITEPDFELLPIKVKLQGKIGQKGKWKLTFPDKVMVWYKNRTRMMSNTSIDTVLPQEVELIVEGINASQLLKDAEIKGELVLDDAPSLTCRDQQPLTVFNLDMINPVDTNGDGNINDPEEDHVGVGNEFTFWDTANRFHGSAIRNNGQLRIDCEARIQPEILKDYLRWKVFNGANVSDASGVLFAPAGTTRRWDGSQKEEGSGLVPKFTVDDMPANNADFGQKTVRLQLLNPSDATRVSYETTQPIEVFWPLLIDLAGARNDANFAKNHPGDDINSTAAENNGDGPGQRSPSWFYYWRQVVPNTDQARYAGTHIPGFGRTPSVRWFQTGYVGRHDRLLIGEIAQGADMLGGITTGIDAFDDTVQHEQHHAIDQSVGYTNTAFGLGITGASNVADNHWSFNIHWPGVVPIPPLPPGRIYNHYRDMNGDNDFTDPGEDLDANHNDVINNAEPGTVEGLAEW